VRCGSRVVERNGSAFTCQWQRGRCRGPMRRRGHTQPLLGLPLGGRDVHCVSGGTSAEQTRRESRGKRPLPCAARTASSGSEVEGPAPSGPGTTKRAPPSGSGRLLDTTRRRGAPSCHSEARAAPPLDDRREPSASTSQGATPLPGPRQGWRAFPRIPAVGRPSGGIRATPPPCLAAAWQAPLFPRRRRSAR